MTENYNYYTGADGNQYESREDFEKAIAELDYSKTGITVAQLILKLQALPLSVQNEPVFIIYNDVDGVQSVVGLVAEQHTGDGVVDIVRLKIEGEAGRGIV